MWMRFILRWIAYKCNLFVAWQQFFLCVFSIWLLPHCTWFRLQQKPQQHIMHSVRCWLHCFGITSTLNICISIVSLHKKSETKLNLLKFFFVFLNSFDSSRCSFPINGDSSSLGMDGWMNQRKETVLPLRVSFRFQLFHFELELWTRMPGWICMCVSVFAIRHLFS